MKMNLSREQQIEMLGKPISEMPKMEVLNALSVVSARLYAKTGEARYANAEKVALSLMDSEIKGVNTDEAVRRALEEVK